MVKRGKDSQAERGFYTPGLRAGEVEDLQAGQEGLEGEIGMLRVVMRRVFEAAGEDGIELGELAGILGTLGAAATRLAGLMRAQKSLEGGSGAAEALSAALREVTAEIVKK